MAQSNGCAVLLVVIITFFLPPLGVFLISGVSADLIINICLTVLGYIPGHIHAFYLEYVHYHSQEGGRAPGVYSDSAQGGQGGYGTV